MAIDPSIALNANAPQQPNPLQTALQVAQFRAYNANSQAAQQSLDANRAISSAYQQATDPTTGQVDNNRLMAIISQDPAAGYKLGEVVQGINTQRQQQANLNSTLYDQAQKGQAYLRSGIGSLLTKPDLTAADVQQFAGTAVKAGALSPQIYEAELQSMPQDPAQLRPWLAQHFNSALSAEQQIANMKPQFAQINSGPATIAVNQNPNAIGPNGQPMPVGSVGYTVQNGLSPEAASTPTQVFDPSTGAQGTTTRANYVAMSNGQPPPIPTMAQPANMPTSNGQAAPMPSGPAPGSQAGTPRGFVPSGPGMGVQGSSDGNVQAVNTHWTQLSNDAANAQTNIGLAQNIKAYAQKALTGAQGDKLAAANGLLSIFGQGGQTDLQTATDLLQKNMARLSLSSRQSAGGTDAAGALATAANPHGTMTAAAIADAADQVIGSQQMAISEQKVLQPYKLSNNVAAYQQALTQFNQAADPRIWQFANMDPQQRATFKASMSAADQQAFSNKIRTLESMGAIQ